MAKSIEYIEEPNPLEELKVDIRKYLWVILRRKWIIILVFLFITIGAFVYVNLATPVYKTSVKILIGEEKGELSLFRELDFLGQAKSAEQLETYCELLKTHQLICKVVENLKLHELPEYEKDSNSL